MKHYVHLLRGHALALLLVAVLLITGLAGYHYALAQDSKAQPRPLGRRQAGLTPEQERALDKIDFRALSLKELQKQLGKEKEDYTFYTVGKGKGTASLRCPSPIVIGQKIDQVILDYKAPEEGIAPGGMVTVWYPNGSTTPQYLDSAKPGYVELKCDVPTSPTMNYVYNFRAIRNSAYFGPENNRMLSVHLPSGLKPGQSLTFTWNNAQVDGHARRWEGDRFLFRTYVDHDADGWEEEIAMSPWVPKVGQAASKIFLRGNSIVVVGEPVRLTLMAQDPLDNPALSYRGTVAFTANGAGAQLPEPYSFTEQDNGAHTFSAIFTEPGFYWVTAKDTATGFVSTSNPIEVCAKEPEYRLYWGDLHVHTEMSPDARSAAHTVSTYDGSYKIGRYRYGLDFQANTDHHGTAMGSYDMADWREMIATTNRNNAPGTFVTLVATECSHGKGDENIYFLADTAPFIHYGGPQHPQDLWAFLKNYECFLAPHHFAQSMRPWDWDNYDPEVMKLAEIYSNHGRAEFTGNEPHYSHHPIPTIAGKTWVDQLNKGRKLGCIASTDDHWARPGNNGLAGVWAKTLTREDIYWGLKTRHCYATSNARSIVHFTVNGKEMGTEIKSRRAPKISLLAACPTKILAAELIKGGQVVFSGTPDGRMVRFDWTDPNYTGEPAYYYVRIKMEGDPAAEQFLQNKPEFTWSSPVWVEK